MHLLDVKGGAERHAEQRGSLPCAQLVGQEKAERSCLVWSQLQKDPHTWWLREGRSLAGDPLLLSLSSYNATSSHFSLSQLSTPYALMHPHPCNHQLSAALCTECYRFVMLTMPSQFTRSYKVLSVGLRGGSIPHLVVYLHTPGDAHIST